MVSVFSVSRKNGAVPGGDFIGQVTTVEIDQLLPADLIRLGGISDGHVRLLADSELGMPPIVVHKDTMRVIDGMHRLKAAVLRGEKSIQAKLFDGGPEAAYILSVRANNAHGLPLTAADRRAAAGRLLDLCPGWSDRAIATVVGVSANTVAAVRRSTAQIAQSNGRLGRDGRVRPASTAEGRLKAAELMAERPDATLRELARDTGLSLGTVADVRRRVRLGDSPVPTRRTGKATDTNWSDDPEGTPDLERTAGPEGAAVPEATAVNGAGPNVDVASSWQQLTRDPSLRYTRNGRQLLRLLSMHSSVAQIAPEVPSHCSQNVALLARECAQAWGQLAQRLEKLERDPVDSLG
ncbi:ParB/RepB/Spo0J family partition protein [Streptomyces sp. NPDC047974]|uniref:ParB/RepB/Spo0J family partition protein n=1 Tax=Streptomyces sp. NPDC047974 TaxID=3154343 RepID=UPI0033F10D7E